MVLPDTEVKAGYAAPKFLSGGGEMGGRIRAYDWSGTALGAPDAWPQSLKTVVNILLSSRYAMWMLWGTDRTFLCNDAYLPTLGVKGDWALGAASDKVWREIWPDIGPRIERVLKTGEATWDEALQLFLERRGFPEETYHTFSYSPLADDDGIVVGMLCVVTEETERVIGERRLRLLRDLGVGVANCRTARQVWSAVAASLEQDRHDLPWAIAYAFDAGTGAAHLVSAMGMEVAHPAAPLSIGAGDRDPWPLREVSHDHDTFVLHEVGPEHGDLPMGPWITPPLQALIVPIPDRTKGRPSGALVLGLNPHRPIDADFQGFIDLFVGQIAAALAGADAFEAERRRAEALAEIDRAKTTFFANVSHEFRTPLTLMLGPLEELLARSPGGGAAETGRLVEIAHRNSVRLLRLVNALLDFSRIEGGRTQAAFQPVDLAALTIDLASAFRAATDSAGLRLKVACAPLSQPVYVDAAMWETIVLNLVSNAFKFTFDGEIGVELLEIGDMAQLTVSDTGTGIPDSELSQLFERFHRVEGAKGRSIEGSGIGLALVRELVDLHGGRIAVESELGRGTAFTVSVPLGMRHLPPERIAAGTSQVAASLHARAFVDEALRWLPGSGGDEVIGSLSPEGSLAHGSETSALHGRIVLADDNADLRDYIARLLRARGYSVEAVGDGEAALAALHETRADLVVTDVMMPGLDGFGLLKAIRMDSALRDVPVIMLSARAGEDAKVEGLDAGADDYLTKPFSARELLARVAANLSMARMRREAAEAIRATEARAVRVLAGMGEGYVLLDRDFRVVEINEEGLRLERRARDEVVGKTHWEAWPGSEASDQGALYRKAMAERLPVSLELPFVWPAGHETWLEVRAYPSGDGLAIFYRDVSDRKQAAEALRLRGEEFSTLADNVPMLAWMAEANGDIFWYNRRWYEYTGTTPDSQVGWGWESVHDPALLPTITVEWQRSLATGQPFDMVFPLRGADGAYRTFLTRAVPMRDERGQVFRWFGTNVDITAQHEAEKRQLLFLSLADRTRELSQPREIVAAAVGVLGRHLGVSRVGYGEITADGDTVVYQTDYTNGVEHLIGRFPILAFGRDNIAELRRGLTTTYADVTSDSRTSDANFAAIETRAAMAVPLVREGRLRAVLYVNHRDVRDWSPGEVALVEEVAARTWDALERARAEVQLRELNATLERRVEERSVELLRAEDALRQAQKMEAVGQLTGGIAHDFNNLLTIVVGNVDMARRALTAGEANRAHRAMDNAQKGAERAAALTQRLLAFSRRQPLAPKPVDVDRLVAGMSDLLHRALGEIIELEIVTSPGQWNVEVDPNQLESAVLNLAVNARDAMPRGGKLTIETANARLDETYSANHAEVAPGQYVVIAVTDTGSGMSRETLARVFEPFFTTKEVGKGTGLGLSMVYGFTKQSGGHVKLYSEVGEGTTVKIYLPRMMRGVEDEPVTSGGIERIQRKHTILVVEDDEDVRAYTVEILRELGYRVFEAHDGFAALKVLENRNEQIALLFTDVVMPGMSGSELAEQARALRPDLRVLYTSGYTRNAIVHGGRLDPGVEMIAKPFTYQGLDEKISDVLDLGTTNRLLVVEADATLRMFAIEALTTAGYAVDEAATAFEALNRARAAKGRYDAVVLDGGLPDKSGEAVAVELRALYADLPILLTVRDAHADLRSRYDHDRCLGVIVKPYNAAKLNAALTKLGVRCSTK